MNPSIANWFAGRTLDQCVESGRDNLLALRLFAAVLVIFGHGFSIVKVPQQDPIQWAFPMTAAQHVGVMMFFAASGFLITLSFERRPELVRFLVARALRIWPALIACVFAWAFVLGPVLSELPLRDYFATSQPFVYFAHNISLYFDIYPFLPGVFAHNPGSPVVNVSLWTLPNEARAYLCVAAAGAIGLWRYRTLASVMILAAIGWFVLRPLYTHIGADGYTYFGRVLLALFGFGALACLWRRSLPVSSGIMLALVAAALATRNVYVATPLLWLTIAYFVFWLAYVPRLPQIPRGWDLSYGTYLWAFPIQQTMTLFGVRNPFVLFAIVVPTVLPFAAASWILIERPMLRWKSKVRGNRQTLTAASASAAPARP